MTRVLQASHAPIGRLSARGGSGSSGGWVRGRLAAKAEDEIFEKLALVETGFLTEALVQELASVGIFDYQNVFTSHHRWVYRRIGDDTFVYSVAGHWQDYPTLLMKRLLRI